MVFIELFLRFAYIGICAFGGGLATIPFLKELSATKNWFTLDELANMIAVSESTPGAIGVNMSTYVGFSTVMREYNNYFLGFLGGLTATIGFITPSIIVILIICQFLKKFKESKVVKWVFYGLRAASIGLICSAAYSILTLSICKPDAAIKEFEGLTKDNFIKEILPSLSNAIVEFFDYKCLALALVLGILIFKFKKHPIIYILISAIIGIIFQF